MIVSIPRAEGVPGISGPPIWFPGELGFNPNLDDVRWRCAVKRTFGSGTGGSNFFRATQAITRLRQFIYLTFRAAYVQQLSDADDLIYFGLQRHDPPAAMVGRIRVHDASFTPAGPPSANPPRNVAEVTIWTLSGTTWIQQQMSPTWISQHSRMWLQSALDDPFDPNNRWAVQLRIPANTPLRIIRDPDIEIPEIPEIPDITDDGGPNIGTDFDMWYLIHGVVGGIPTLLADNRTAGETTQNNLQDAKFPFPADWDQFKLTSAAATSGGVAISWSDVVVQNAFGEGGLIDNNALNTFVARPRNYSTANIPQGGINATFRIANWGSVAGDPHSPDFSSGSWDYVLNQSGGKLAVNTLNIPPIPAGTNPPGTSPIAHPAMMNLGTGKSLHQCILVTLSGANINFLNDAIFRNMSFDTASLFAEEAEISVAGLKKGSSAVRDVYLALEKINMPPQGHTDEGQFLKASMERLIGREGGKGPLADKLQRARSILSDVRGESDDVRKSDQERKKDQSQRLKRFIEVLSEVDVTEEELDRLFPTVRVHVYHDTGERVTRRDGIERPVLKEQSSFGVYVYHEGTLEGWETSIQGAQRIEENLYLLKVPTGGTRKIRVVVKAIDERTERLLNESIEPIEYPPAKDQEFYKKKQGCMYALWKLLGFK